MDTTTRRLVDYAMGANFANLPSEVVHECKRRLIDSFASAVGAYHEPLCQAARTVAQRYSGGKPTARVWGCKWQTTPDAAAFANGVMLRFLDINDLFRVKSGGHPSDVIPGILAVGEAVHADGASVMNAIVLAYDIYCGFCEMIDINEKGWDQPVYGVLACVIGASKLLDLSEEQMGNAIALALAPNMALAQVRHGELSAWKGCAGANASRNAVFAAFLARDGISGPTQIFEGKGGLWDIVGRFDWQLRADLPHRVTATHMRCFPICSHAQSAVWAALELRSRLRPQDIREIQIETYKRSFEMLGNDPSRWAPTNRETADHSLPYVVAIALLDGEITPRSFSETRLFDQTVSSLMNKVKVQENPQFSSQYPESAYSRLRVRMLSGEEIKAEVRYPKGHIRNQIDDPTLEAKFRSMFVGFADELHCEKALHELWNFEDITDVEHVSRLFYASA